jgi:heme-degrading monooxygenase HmoA
MVSLTTITFFKFQKNKPWAFAQMGLLQRKIKKTNGLFFLKLMGTGGGNGFSLRPDFGTYALLAVWESENAASNFFDKNEIINRYKSKAFATRNIKMLSLKSHGFWSGQNPFPEQKVRKIPKKMPVAIITRATLRLSRLISFWKSVPAASAAIERAKGVKYFKGIGEWPFIQQATLSLWDSFDSVKNFAYSSKIHTDIIKKTRKQKWYSEDLFARFQVLSDTGFIHTNED